MVWYNTNTRWAQYNSTKLTLSFSQLKELKSATKNETMITLRLSWNMIGNSKYKANFPDELLLLGKF